MSPKHCFVKVKESNPIPNRDMEKQEDGMQSLAEVIFIVFFLFDDIIIDEMK